MASYVDLLGGGALANVYGATPAPGPSVGVTAPTAPQPATRTVYQAPTVGPYPGVQSTAPKLEVAAGSDLYSKLAESFAKNMSMAQYGTYDNWQKILDSRGTSGVINDYKVWTTMGGPKPYSVSSDPMKSNFTAPATWGNLHTRPSSDMVYGGLPGGWPGPGGSGTPGIPPPGTLPGGGGLPGGPPSAGYIGMPGQFPGASTARPTTPQWWDALRARYQAQALRS